MCSDGVSRSCGVALFSGLVPGTAVILRSHSELQGLCEQGCGLLHPATGDGRRVVVGRAWREKPPGPDSDPGGEGLTRPGLLACAVDREGGLEAVVPGLRETPKIIRTPKGNIGFSKKTNRTPEENH